MEQRVEARVLSIREALEIANLNCFVVVVLLNEVSINGWLGEEGVRLVAGMIIESVKTYGMEFVWKMLIADMKREGKALRLHA